MQKKQLEELCEAVEDIVKDTKNIVELHQATPFSFETKHDGSRVTKTDIAVEQFLIQKLSVLLPQASFYTEEAGIPTHSSDYVWVIDPIDGTTNYSLGLSYYCISVALVHNNTPLLAVVYQPTRQELFTAIKDGGFFYNNHYLKNIHTSSSDTAVLACTGLVYTPKTHYLLYTLAQTFYTVRIFGASALDMAYCALGRLDGIICKDIQWWDIAAGILLMQEAGCIVSDWQQHVIDQHTRAIIGGSKLIFSDLIKNVQENIQDC